MGLDNGLLSVVAARAMKTQSRRIIWRPQMLCPTLHGRDLFAPIAAWIARGDLPIDQTEETEQLQVRLGPDDLSEVIYIDHYGNALTGLRARNVPRNAVIAARERRVPYARIFADASAGGAFWYENSIGPVELAANCASAAALLGIRVGDPVSVIA